MEQKNKTRYFGPVFLLLAIVFTIVIYKTNGSSTQDIRSNAEEDPNFCQNQCAGRNRCDLNDTTRTNDPNLNDPCCEEVARTGDPGACPWPQRGYCTVDQCNAIPEGVSRERCGGPRWQWCENCKANNCPGYGTNVASPTVASTSTPVPTVPLPTIQTPTAVIIPTELPLPTATAVPALPTEIVQIPKPQITHVQVVYPTIPPSAALTPTKVPFKVSLPQILPPREKIISFWDGVKTNLQNFFSKILP